MNALGMIETYDQDPLIKSLLTIEILSINDLNYQFIDVGMGNYYLHENTQPIFVTTKNEYEVWIIFFDGARSKHGCDVDVVFKSPYVSMRRFYFWFTWTCTNNATKYEALCVGLSKAISMDIRYLIFYQDYQLVINKISTKYDYLKT